MAKIKNFRSAPNNEQIFRFKQGYFGLKSTSYIPPAIMQIIAVHGKYWSPYHIEQYLIENDQKGRPNSLKGWYFTSEAVNVLINQGFKVFINIR